MIRSIGDSVDHKERGLVPFLSVAVQLKWIGVYI